MPSNYSCALKSRTRTKHIFLPYIYSLSRDTISVSACLPLPVSFQSLNEPSSSLTLSTSVSSKSISTGRREPPGAKSFGFILEHTSFRIPVKREHPQKWYEEKINIDGMCYVNITKSCGVGRQKWTTKTTWWTQSVKHLARISACPKRFIFWIDTFECDFEGIVGT